MNGTAGRNCWLTRRRARQASTKIWFEVRPAQTVALPTFVVVVEIVPANVPNAITVFSADAHLVYFVKHFCAPLSFGSRLLCNGMIYVYADGVSQEVWHLPDLTLLGFVVSSLAPLTGEAAYLSLGSSSLHYVRSKFFTF